MGDSDIFCLRGDHVIVTGASGGIGLAIVSLFLKLGANISAQGNSKTAVLESLAQNTHLLNVIQADATNEEDVERFYSIACSKFGPPEVLVGSMTP